MLPKEKLPKTKEVEGPPTKQKLHSNKFRQKHEEAYVKDQRLYARIQREFTNGKKLVEDISNGKYIRERIKRIRIIK